MTKVRLTCIILCGFDLMAPTVSLVSDEGKYMICFNSVRSQSEIDVPSLGWKMTALLWTEVIFNGGYKLWSHSKQSTRRLDLWCEGSHIAGRKKLSGMIISLYLIFVLLRTVSNYHQHFGNQNTFLQTLNNFPISSYCTYIFNFLRKMWYFLCEFLHKFCLLSFKL